MGKKLIRPEKIQGIQATMQRLVSNSDIATNNPTSWLEDDSAHKLSDAHAAMAQSSEHLSEAVESLNKYMDAVAAAFANADSALQQMIGKGGLQKTPIDEARKKARQEKEKKMSSAQRRYSQKQEELANRLRF